MQPGSQQGAMDPGSQQGATELGSHLEVYIKQGSHQGEGASKQGTKDPDGKRPREPARGKEPAKPRELLRSQ